MTYMTTKNRDVIRMAVTPEAKARLDAVAADRDMKLVGVVSRVIEWFSSQDKTLQSVILGLIDDEDAPSVLGLIHKRLAQELTDKHLDIDATLGEAAGRAPARQKTASGRK